jgi:hypothetical protein
MRTLMPEDDSHLDEQLFRRRRVRSERADWSLAGRRREFQFAQRAPTRA